VLGPLAVQSSLDVGVVLLAIGGLSFLGLGVQPPDPEWGTMLVEARPFLDYAPHLMLAPGLALFLTVFGCNALGEMLAPHLMLAPGLALFLTVFGCNALGEMLAQHLRPER
jgi:ABC-type dipeptide/oligopeptide/nickel transport system permease subunit